MSFNIGLSALNAAQEEIAVTGNNIANASTNGFKSSRAEFADVYAASVLGGSRQGGGGVSLQTISQNFTQGNITFTDNTLDLALNGQGFFVLGAPGDSDEKVYTRSGAFGTDKDGYIINNTGDRLQGIDDNGGEPFDLQITREDIDPQGTTRVDTRLNLDAGTAPSSIIGRQVVTNEGNSGEPLLGQRTAQAARIVGVISTEGTDFSGTVPATVVGTGDISGGLNFLSAGGNQGFRISVNGQAYTSIDLSGADAATPADVRDQVQAQLDAAFGSSLVNVTLNGDTLQLETAAQGDNARIAIDSVEGLASEFVTEGDDQSGKTAPQTGFTISLDGISQEVVIDQNFTNDGAAARALGGGNGQGNEALEDYIQSTIDSNASLAGKINVSIDSSGQIAFTATEAGAQQMIIDPLYSSNASSVNFNEIVSFSTNRRAGELTITDYDFATTGTSFEITVGDVTETITIDEDFRIGVEGPADLLGDTVHSSLEALEDFIQTAISTSNLPGAVKFSIGANGNFVFQITDDAETSIEVNSTSTPASIAGTEDVTDGFDFETTPYTFTITYNDDGGATPSVTSANIDLDQNYASADELLDAVNTILRDDATGLSTALGDNPVVASIDPDTGVLVFSTDETGPNASLAINVTTPGAGTVVATTAAVNGSGPARDFASIATFEGSELDNSGVDAQTNGYVEEVIEVLDADGNTQLITVAAGSSASEVAAQFSAVTGVAAKGTTVAYITATNTGDVTGRGYEESNLEMLQDLPVYVRINSTLYEARGDSHNARMDYLADRINERNSSVTAKYDEFDGVAYLEITENNGADLRFSGDEDDGQGSISIVGSTQDAEGNFIPSDDEPVQLANLANRTNDTIIVGGVVEFTLDEGVTLRDAEIAANGVPIQPEVHSIFGAIEEDTLVGDQFELNTFDPDNPDTYYRSTAVEIFDSLGNPHTLIQYFVKERPGPNDVGNSVWSVYFQVDGQDIGPADDEGEPTLAQATIRFNSSGIYDSTQPDINITNWQPDGANGPLPGQTGSEARQNSSNFEINLSSLTQFGGNFSVRSNTQDGYASGSLTGLEINSDGRIDARFSNGQSQSLGFVAIAQFANESKLANIGGTRFAATTESGDGTITSAEDSGTVAVQSGALEDSNVDLSEQLVQLIVSQRNFQAAAQIIESIDTSTQTIINL
ncbi:MAG: flagellar hook-basal body complex protein [Pseudohongiellaceae bacterium]|nr:flagellar hook-basal body complex protein [Pseudohongiellaceae bacterium]